jgi:hypothetical protein
LDAAFSIRHQANLDAENSAQWKQFGAQTALSRDIHLRSEPQKVDTLSRYTETQKFNSENNK